VHEWLQPVHGQITARRGTNLLDQLQHLIKSERVERKQEAAQPGITAATTALAVEHNSRCAASGMLPQPSPHFPAIRNSISPASIVEVQLRFSTCGRKRVHVI
jgi:hypothetical protein